MVHEDTLWVCLTCIGVNEVTEKRRAFILGAKVAQYWNLYPQYYYTFPSVGPHDLQLYQNDSTYKVHEKSYKIKVSKETQLFIVICLAYDR